MEPKRKATIQGIPAVDPSEAPTRRHSRTIRKQRESGEQEAGAEQRSPKKDLKRQTHRKVLDRRSDPYHVTSPGHHDQVSLPDAAGKRARRSEAPDGD